MKVCAWCLGPIPGGKRRDAQTCSQRCRQAKARFAVSPAAPRHVGGTIRVAYADPPYPGLARRYYGCEEVDHRQLVAELAAGFPDGWALSTSSDALEDVLAICRAADVHPRTAAWVRGSRSSRAYRPRNAWEPLLVVGGRPVLLEPGEQLDDVLVHRGRQRSHPGALVGMKPAAFCEWMFRQLGLRQGDELVDLYPGSGAVGRAWDLYASPVDDGDTSQLEHSDTSRAAARRVPSRAHGRDASPRARRDASPSAARDTSTAGGRDASRQYLSDASGGEA